MGGSAGSRRHLERHDHITDRPIQAVESKKRTSLDQVDIGAESRVSEGTLQRTDQ